MPTTVAELDLTPIPGKRYFHIDRGVQTPDDFYGGTIKSISQNLAYIAGLGCTANWLTGTTTTLRTSICTSE